MWHAYYTVWNVSLIIAEIIIGELRMNEIGKKDKRLKLYEIEEDFVFWGALICK